MHKYTAIVWRHQSHISVWDQLTPVHRDCLSRLSNTLTYLRVTYALEHLVCDRHMGLGPAPQV